jgi:hypothetical protein
MPDLRPNYQDYASQATVGYLATLPYSLAMALTDLNDTSSWTPSIDFGYPDFTPSHFSILVNSFWLLSLLISLTCALIAILLQHWARRYANVTSPCYSLREQARMRAFFAAGIERLKFEYVAEILPVLIQISFIFFIAGFLLFVLILSYTMTVLVIACSWIALCFLAYVYITFMPIFRPDSPFYTPFSNVSTRIYAGVLCAALHVLWLATSLTRVTNATRENFRHSRNRYYDLLLLGTMKFAEEEARQRSHEIDGDVLKRTLDGLSDDHNLGLFFEGILGFCDSEMVKDPHHCLDILGRKRLGQTLEGFWNRTLSTDVIPEAERERQIVTCLKVVYAARLSPDDLSGVFRSVEIGNSLRKFGGEDSQAVLLARCIISGIISKAERDERWFTLAKDELGVSEEVFRSYLVHDDNVLLANLIHLIRKIIPPLFQAVPDLTREPLRILSSVSKLDILNTLPELQHEFCALWNEITQQVRKGGGHYNLFTQILLEIRHLYVALHPTDITPQDSSAFTTDVDSLRQQASYPMCKRADHYSDLVPDIHEATSGTVDVTSQPTTSTAASHTFPNPGIALATVTPILSSLSSETDHFSRGSSPRDTRKVYQFLPPSASPCYSTIQRHHRTCIASTHTGARVISSIADTSHESCMIKSIPHSASNTDDSQEPNEIEMVSYTAFESPCD